MKKLTIIYIIFALCTTANAQLQEENFNATTLPAGWTVTKSANDTWQFGYTGNIVGSGSGSSGTYASFPSGGAYFSDNDSGPSDNNVLTLTSPAIDLVAANLTSAGIEVIYNHQAFGKSGNFMIDVWDGSAWQNIWFVDGDDTASNTGTSRTVNLDVTPYINDAFQVRFTYDDENTLTWGVGIDHYKLSNTATASVEDLLAVGFSYSPNPVKNNILNLKANEDISQVNIYNTIGQKVLVNHPIVANTNLDLQHLPNGVYFVQVAIGQREGSFKIVKQ
ncbi:T9SS type A sorting domain-containing protein [Flavobacteriaceae bacterium F08102]|nr:T9SS type A sorting domain-containing protein [Flavobacteriaceae bacterium F08102]